MKKTYFPFLLSAVLLFSGCGSVPVEQRITPEQAVTGGESRTFSKEFALEHRTDPPLTDQSSAYLTEDFGGIEGTGWVPIRFVDNDSFLYRERAEDSQNPWVCRYHLRTGQKDKLFPVQGGAGNLFRENASNFSFADNLGVISIKDDRIETEISFASWKQEHQEYEACDIVANPRTGKIALVDNTTWKCILTDFDLKEVSALPFEGVYRAGWVDDDNLILGAFDQVEKHQGSAVITYNIQDKATTKTYIGDNEVFVDPYRDSGDYCGFTYLDDDHGPPGTLGVVDYTKNKIIFLKLSNIAWYLNLQYNWVIAAAADQPIDWDVWGGTTEGTVNLCVYDAAAGSYGIRARNLSRPNGAVIISPDGRTIIYQSFSKNYLIREK
ncbi:hypothetical protein [Syntrophobotulus glycolicus]|uniref:hypothetical protein n=1 Tax=Syntrophobotulus glycolicus TaxID=51197 RepID=UPI001FA759A0|nr:hypothetical protein [Syntrophobotulus glycolicus]